MNIAIAATTLALVVPAELPDKTFISCVVLASRYRALPVWIGAASGLVLQAGVAVVAGGLLDLLPHTAVQGVVAALFLGGAAYLLFVPEKAEERRGADIARQEMRALEGDGGAPGEEPKAGAAGDGGAPVPAGAGRTDSDRGSVSIALSTFGVIVLAEFGDLTQVLTANLAARYHDPVSVFAGAAVGFCLISVVGVLGGRLLTRYVPMSLVRRISGLALLGFGIYTLVTIVSR